MRVFSPRDCGAMLSGLTYRVAVNDLGETGAQALADALKENRTLTALRTGGGYSVVVSDSAHPLTLVAQWLNVLRCAARTWISMRSCLRSGMLVVVM
jgi:hypothetical protein